MVNFLDSIPGCESRSPASLDLFLSSAVSTSSMVAFHPLGNSGHVVVSVSTDFPSEDVLFYRTAYEHSCVDWNGLRDHLRDVPWKDDVYVLQRRKYHVNPHLSLWVSHYFAAAIVHRNHFFCLYQQNKYYASKVKIRQTSNYWNRVVVGFPETNLLYFLYLMDLWCCLPLLIKQNSLQKAFLRI